MEFSNPVQPSEGHLVQLAVKRDRAAFTALYESCVQRVYRHVYYKVSSHADAEDITQEAFVRAWKYIDKYKSTGAPFVTWIIAIAGNLVIDHYRKPHNTMLIGEIFEDNPNIQIPDTSRELEVNFDNEVIRKAVLKLKGDKQRVIMLHFIDGLTYAEIAAALNKSEGAIRVIQYRALSELKTLLKKRD
jgi:RNA polymerase sigma-70 factor (ECF subfamily)